MTNQILTPVAVGPDNTGTDLTAALVAATQTTLQFNNASGVQLLVLSTGTTTTVTVNVGAQVLGQAVTAFTPVTLTSANHIYNFGPFHTALNQPGTIVVTVTLNSVTGVSVALIDPVGVF